MGGSDGWQSGGTSSRSGRQSQPGRLRSRERRRAQVHTQLPLRTHPRHLGCHEQPICRW